MRPRESSEPRPPSQKLYDRAFQVYRQIHETCADLNHEVAALAAQLHDLRQGQGTS
ncbi:MAG: hypothetical protein ACLF0G_00730 [Candidatus Brocadiia bacterium]